MVDEYPSFTWLLRAQAFRKFGYDPDKVFAIGHDELGFASGFACQVVKEPELMGSGPVPLDIPG
jgi:hypothetical protein